MNKNIERLVYYHEKGIEPTRYKTSALVYSEMLIKKEIAIKLNDYDVKLIPITDEQRSKTKHFTKYMPAFLCEVIADSTVHKDGNKFDLEAALNEILTWLEFDYELEHIYSQWEEYEGEWVGTATGSFTLFSQGSYTELPKPNIYEILLLIEKAKTISNKRANKILTLRIHLQNGLRLKKVSSVYSFLSFYKVIETVADDLASCKYCATTSESAKEIVEFQLTVRGSQRAKIYYLLKAIENQLPLKDSVLLADVRNEIAHNDHDVDQASLTLCQKVAFWSAEKFVEIIAKKQ